MRAFFIAAVLSTSARADSTTASADCVPFLDRLVTIDLPVYTRWLVEDGVLRPTAQLEALLATLNRVRDRNAIDDVKDLIGPAAEVLPRAADMIRVASQVLQLDRGYQQLRLQCHRVLPVLRRQPEPMRQTLTRSEAILVELAAYLHKRPGRDTTWAVDQIGRAQAHIERFAIECFENPPPPQPPSFFTRMWHHARRAFR